jgi:hypothetical protein
MSDFHSPARPSEGTMNFLDATDDEIVELVRTLINQLAIMSSCLAMPTEQKKAIRANIASFEAYLDFRHQCRENMSRSLHSVVVMSKR